ncbi:Dad1 [Kluyveromyces lactis]|nr:Dad1 [Kluyveromyces lactis]
MTEEVQQLSAGDKYFIEQRSLILQEINESMDAILNQLNGLNITLENSIAVGKEFENVSQIWKLFYNGLESEEQNMETVGVADCEHITEDVNSEGK